MPLRTAALLAGFLLLSPARAQSPESDVYYHIFVRSYADSDGDRHGDLRGILEHLDYLDDLGITGILLSPIHASPFYHNYFADSFEEVDPEYGTWEDFRELTRALHERGMKLILDVEMQYVTGEHPWFRESFGHPGSEAGDYIIYKDSLNTTPEPGFFTLESVPSYDGSWIRLAMVNQRHPRTRSYMEGIFRKLCDPNGDGDPRDGVDGFRLDHIMDDMDYKGIQTDLLSEFWRPLFREVRKINPDILFLGEQANWWYGTDILEQADANAVFAFPLSRAIASFDKRDIVNKADSTLALTPAGKQQFVFVENHDTDRIASVLKSDPGRLRVAAALNLLLKGTPILYYGQEIGMTGTKQEWMSDGNDIPRREAFEWYEVVDTAGVALWYRDTGPWWEASSLRDHDGRSVEEERRDPTSLWHYYRSLIALRKATPALRTGDQVFVESGSPDVLAFTRTDGGSSVLALVNLSDRPATVRVAKEVGVPAFGRCRPEGGAHALAPYEVSVCAAAPPPGTTEITRWQDGKRGAVSLTWDDGSLNQVRVAAPIMDSLGVPATFFIITGQIPGSRYHGRFIGRPVEDIIAETASVPTNVENLFERASAVGFLGLKGTLDFHTRAGAAYDAGRVEEAISMIDEAYQRVRADAFEPSDESVAEGDVVTWVDLEALAAKGHEIASHTVTHPRLAVLDEPNLLYELQMSRAEIAAHLGEKHTFSVEGPYGTEDERAVKFALDNYPAARNRMPEPFLDEHNRWDRRDPAASGSEYVQWQRGPLAATPASEMRAWLDKVAGDDNIWLVLVFHGVDGIGWEARSSEDLRQYFECIHSKEKRLWVATFQDVTKYMRERMSAEIAPSAAGDEIRIDLRHRLDARLYDLPLTLKTVVPAAWRSAEVRQGAEHTRAAVVHEDGVDYILYRARPNGDPILIYELP